MRLEDATETAYKNGYEDGKRDAVKHGRWILEAHEEYANYRWNVTAECSECHAEKKEVYAGFISGFPKDVAEQIILEHAESVKLPNYCSNCGARMTGDENEQKK